MVLKNNSRGQTKWKQMAFLGNPEFGCEPQPIDDTSGWHDDSWKGRFFSPELRVKDQLQYYATQFRTTKINGVFYRTPTEDAVKRVARSDVLRRQRSPRGTRRSGVGARAASMSASTSTTIKRVPPRWMGYGCTP